MDNSSVSDIPEQVSPECLVVLNPEKDPYSSEDDKLKLTASHDSKSTYNGISVLPCCLKRHFKLQFHRMSEFESTLQYEEFEISKLLDSLLKFVIDKNEITGQTVLKELFTSVQGCTLERSHVAILKFLFDNGTYHIDMRDSVELNGICDIRSLVEMKVVEFFWTLYDVFTNINKDTALDSEDHYNYLKMCMNKFLGLTGESITDKGVGSCMLTGLVDVANKKEMFKSDPDMTLGMDGYLKSPVIPVEVYSPIKQSFEETRAETKEICFKDSNDDTDKDAVDSIVSFLTQNIPAYMFESSCPKFTGDDFKNKLVSQHIIQILGAAANYCFRKKCTGAKLNKNRAFIGLLVYQQYIYVSKVIGDELQFAKYKEHDFTAAKPEFGKRYRVVSSIKELSNLHVCVSPVVFDLAIHNHRMALLFFLKYYMRNLEYLMCH